MEQPRNSVQQADLKSQKHLRMHELAKSLLANGEAVSALNIWRKIARESPEFPGIHRFIREAEAQAASHPVAEKRSDPSIYRLQRNMIDENRPSRSRVMRFEPKPGVTPPKRRIRHRHIAYIFMIGFLLFILGSIRNKRTFMLIINPESGVVKCYQGAFFPYGWEHYQDYDIGLYPGWENDLENTALRDSLIDGLKLHGAAELDQTILLIYRDLGRQALRQKTIDKQQEALYYFSRIENAHFKKEINWDMATAYFNLARLYLAEQNDPRQALECLRKTKRYVPSYPGVDELNERIRARMS